MEKTSPGLTAVGALQLLTRWLAIYAIGLVGIVLFLVGFLPETLLLIVVSEVVLLSLRRQPNFGARTYAPPAPAEWQAPIAALRWVGLVSGCWTLGVFSLVLGGASIVLTIMLPIIAIRGWPYHLGPANFIVLGLLGTWLLTRPLWITPLRRALKVQTMKQFSKYMASMSVIQDGVLIDVRPINVGPLQARQQVFKVAFAELDEVRAMDGLTAQGYQLSMGQYDPTLMLRVEWELFRFLSGQLTRPTLCFAVLGFGTHVLMRSSTLLYLIGNADQSAPTIVAAWQAWQSAPRTQAAPTA